MTFKHAAALSAVILILLMLGSSGFAQGQRGSLIGRVTDAQGVPLPGVMVTLTSATVLAPRTQITDGSGTFVFVGLALDEVFSVECRLEGFATIVLSDVAAPRAGHDTPFGIQMRRADEEEVVVIGELASAGSASPTHVPPPPPPPAALQDPEAKPSISYRPRPTAEDWNDYAMVADALDVAAEVEGSAEWASAGSDSEDAAAEDLAPPVPLQQMLEEAELAFIHPGRVRRDEEFLFEAAVSFAGIEEEVLSELAALGDLSLEDLELSTSVEIKLTGAKFDIEPIVPEKQLVEPDSTTRWKWRVGAKESGRQRLHLAVIAYKDAALPDLPKAVKTYERDIEVTVSPAQALGGFVTTHWEWVMTAIVIPLVFSAWRRWAVSQPV